MIVRRWRAANYDEWTRCREHILHKTQYGEFQNDKVEHNGSKKREERIDSGEKNAKNERERSQSVIKSNSNSIQVYGMCINSEFWLETNRAVILDIHFHFHVVHLELRSHSKRHTTTQTVWKIANIRILFAKYETKRYEMHYKQIVYPLSFRHIYTFAIHGFTNTFTFSMRYTHRVVGWPN